MLGLLKSLKKIIERKVVNIQPLREDLVAGSATIKVKSAKRFLPNDTIVIYRDGEEDGELRKVIQTTDWKTITIGPVEDGGTGPITENYSTLNGKVQNVVAGNQWIHGIYIGDPPVIPRYPAITIFGKNRSSEWLTLDSTTETYNVDITVYIEAAHYEEGYELVLTLTKDIEDTLFKSFYPLVEPYLKTTLLNDVSASDTIIRVADDTLARKIAWFWLESDHFTMHGKPKCYLGNGVIEVVAPFHVPFEAGDDVIFPLRHFYDTRAESTEIGAVTKNTLLWGSRINYYAKEEVFRHDPFFHPLDR